MAKDKKNKKKAPAMSAEQRKKLHKQRQKDLEKTRAKGPPPPPPKRPTTVGEALGVKPLKLAKASDFIEQSSLKPDQTAKVLKKPADPLPVPIIGETPEEVAYIEAAATVDKLMAESDDVRRITGCLVATRRLYATFYRELQDLLEGVPDKSPLTEDFIVQAAAHSAAEAFSEHELMQGFVQTMLPYIADIVDRHTDKDKKDEQTRYEQVEADRRARNVPIGFKHYATQEAEGLDREKPLVLTGWAPALAWLADQIVTHVLVERDSDVYTVIRFMTAAPKKGDFQKQLIRLPDSIWGGCSNGQQEFRRVMGEHVGSKLSALPDLLLIDDLAKAFTKAYVGRPEPANAGDAIKVAGAWCKMGGCALVGMLPIDEMELPDIRSGEYEQLRNFTYLRPVTVVKTEDGKQYHIRVGDFAASFKVNCDVVDAYTRTKIYLPNG